MAQTIAGVQIGDDLVSADRGKMVRIRVESASVYLLDDGILFQFRGRRYRKDGLPGKLDHTVYLRVNNNWED